MSHDIYILVIEDELEVLDSLVLDLEDFEAVFPLETANTTEEARTVISEIYDAGNVIGLILCDHILPGENGVDLLVELQAHNIYRTSKKVLVTGQAGLQDTIQAINKANLNHYIAKPWTKQGLNSTVVKQLTDFVIEQKYNPLEYMAALDAERLSEFLRGNQPTDH